MRRRNILLPKDQYAKNSRVVADRKDYLINVGVCFAHTKLYLFGKLYCVKRISYIYNNTIVYIVGYMSRDHHMQDKLLLEVEVAAG